MSAPPPWRKTAEWQAIAKDNEQLFDVALDKFCEEYSKYISAFSISTKLDTIYSQTRYDEFVRSCTDDLYRYATYHPVKKKQVFCIQESVRASYITKWFMVFKPLLLDSYVPLTTKEALEKLISLPEHIDAFEFFRKSNELFVLHFASVALRVKTNTTKPGEVANITDFFDKDLNQKEKIDKKEYSDFMYTLRYRLASQDVYRPIYRRIETLSL